MREYSSFSLKVREAPKLLLDLKMVLLVLFLNSLSLFAQESSVKFISLFNGKSLAGWKTVNPADQSLWSVTDSVITCGDGVNKIESNTYLQTEKEYSDFEFRCLFRLSGDHNTGFINSGIQYRDNPQSLQLFNLPRINLI